MKVQIILIALSFACVQIYARDSRLSFDCLVGKISAEKCCAKVPNARYANLRNPANCSTFFHCEHGAPVLKDCAASLHWSVKADRCEWPHDAKCTEYGPTTIRPTTSTAAPTTTRLTTTTRRPTTTTARPTTTTVRPTTTTVRPTTTTLRPTSSSTRPTTLKPSTTTGGPIQDCSRVPHGCRTGSISANECCAKYSGEHCNLHLPHENNCSLFYQCEHGKPTRKNCPAPLHFNPILEVCDWPESAGCASGSTGTPTSRPTTSAPTTARPTTAAPTTTTRRPTTTTARPTTTTARPTTTTERPTTTTARPTTTTARPTTTTERSTTTTARPTTTTEGPINDCSHVPNGCRTGAISAEECCEKYSGEHCNLHLPHENNCSLFYQCEHGKPTRKNCPAPLHFNPILEVCDWPEKAGCASGSTGTPTSRPTTSAPTTARPTTVAPTTTTRRPTTTTARPTTTTERPTTTTARPTTTTERPTTTTARPTTTTEGPINDCSHVPNGCRTGDISAEECCEKYSGEYCNLHLPHENNCSLFYQCEHGKPTRKDCPAPLHFNPILEVCDWPESAGCASGSTGSPTSRPTTSAPTTASPTTARPTTTTRRPTTTTARPTTTTARPTTTTARPTTTTARPTTTTEGPINDCSHVPNGCRTGDISAEECCEKYSGEHCNLHLPHENNCSLFYQCEHGKPTRKDCPAPLHFNPILEVCDWPESAGCASGSTGSPTSRPTTSAPTTARPTTAAPTTTTRRPTTTTARPTTTTARPTTTTERPTTTTARPTTTTEGPINDCSHVPNGCRTGDISAEECCEKYSGEHCNLHLPHENNCSLFYQCEHGKPTRKDCPAPLHFNPILEVCDWPDKAGCASGSTGTPTSRPTTSAPTTASPTTARPTTVAPTTSAPITTTEGTTSTPPITTSPPEIDPPTCQSTICEQCLSGQFPANECCKNVQDYEKIRLVDVKDCGSYHQCVGGKAVRHNCPRGLHFSKKSDRCEHKEDSECKA